MMSKKQMSIMDSLRQNIESFDPTLRVNLRTDTLRDDEASRASIVQIEKIKQTMPGYLDYANSWEQPVWSPADQQLQNDYNRASSQSLVNCNGQRLAGPTEYHPQPKRNYSMSASV